MAIFCIASVLDIPAAGFPYASVMPYLYENAIKDYLRPICKDFIVKPFQADRVLEAVRKVIG